MFSFVEDKCLNWVVRRAALITLSYFELNTNERKSVQKLFSGETNFNIKKAILICLIQAPKKTRETVLHEALCDTDYRVGLFAKFLIDIQSDIKTQLYEIKNFSRISNKMFIEESYKLLLLRESESIEILDSMRIHLKDRALRKSPFPYHIRHRITSTHQYIKDRIRELKLKKKKDKI